MNTSTSVTPISETPKQPQQRQTTKDIIAANVKSLIEQLEAGHSDALTAYLDAMTGEIQKGKYVYYRCTGHRGKCDLPRFREEDIAVRLGQPLKAIQVPSEIVARIVQAVREDDKQPTSRMDAERSRLEARLTGIRNRIDAAYTDKLDGKIPEDFWERKMTEWRGEEQQVRLAIQGLRNAKASDRALAAQEILKLANSAYCPCTFRRIQPKRPNCSLLGRRCKCNGHLWKAV